MKHLALFLLITIASIFPAASQRPTSATYRQLATETGRLFAELSAAGCAAGSYALNDFDDVWGAVRHFFSSESRAEEAAPP